MTRAGGADQQRDRPGMGIDKHTIGRWRNRFAAARLDGLHDGPLPGAPRPRQAEPRAHDLEAARHDLAACDARYRRRHGHGHMLQASWRQEFRKVRRSHRANVPADLEFHIGMDNVAAPKKSSRPATGPG